MQVEVTINALQIVAMRAAGFTITPNVYQIFISELSFDEKKQIILGGDFCSYKIEKLKISELDDELVLRVMDAALLGEYPSNLIPELDSCLHLQESTLRKLTAFLVSIETELTEELVPYYDTATFSFTPESYESFIERCGKYLYFDKTGLEESFRDSFHRAEHAQSVRYSENAKREVAHLETLPKLTIKIQYSKFDSVLKDGVRTPKPIGFELVETA